MLDAGPRTEASAWARRAAQAFAAESVYPGLEGILKVLVEQIDGSLAAGSSWHRLLLEQAAAAVPGVRPAIISERTFGLLDDLRRFRHVIRNNYALELRGGEVEANITKARDVLPAFRADLAAFEAVMAGSSGRA